MHVTNVDVWCGWALQCAKEGIVKQMPAWVAKSIHPDCENPTHVWAMAVGIQNERLALRSGERLAREVMGTPAATMDAAEAYLDSQLNAWVMDLAYGSFGEDW